MSVDRTVMFKLGNMLFEYDQVKNETNIKKHGISFRIAARIFFDYDRIEYYDDKHSSCEVRYNSIGDISAGNAVSTTISSIGKTLRIEGKADDIIFVVYTERYVTLNNGEKTDVTRIISARLATNFERGLYYGKYE